MDEEWEELPSAFFRFSGFVDAVARFGFCIMLLTS